MPNVRTMQGLLAYCAAPSPYPSFEGEKQKNSKRAKDDVVRIKGREISSDLDIDTLDNPTLARLLLSYQTPLEIKEGELLEPIGVRRNKKQPGAARREGGCHARRGSWWRPSRSLRS